MSNSATAAIAIATAAAAVLALATALLAWLQLKRVRTSQQVMLGGGKDDLVDFAVSLQARIDDLHRAVDEVAAGLARVDRRVDESLAKTSIVRYDAYEGTGGQQSASVEVIEELDQALRSATTTFPWPHVIRLVQYVRVPRTVQRKISRRALFARDDWRCVYCGSAGGRLTLDHVVPKSRGGESVWENVVTSCAPCNLRKGNRLPHEVSMELRRKPRAPAPVLFIRLAAPKIPDGWQPYLSGLSTA